MKLQIVFLTLLAAFGVSGCTRTWETDYGEPLSEDVSQNWRVSTISVNVPDELKVSNANSFAPEADIVWLGEPIGDRKAQVAALFETGISRAVRSLHGSQQVELVVTVEEFHAITPRAVAFAPSAVHNIRYTLEVLDTNTRMQIAGPTHIEAALPALVGAVAYEAAANGQTQKVRITSHLEKVTAGWLGIGPDIRRTFQSVGR